MKIVMRTETRVVEERELVLNDALCDEFNAYVKYMGHSDFEPIAPVDVILMEDGKFSRFNQPFKVKGYGDREYEVSLEDYWHEWIEDELWDCESEVLDSECDYQEVSLREDYSI